MSNTVKVPSEIIAAYVNERTDLEQRLAAAESLNQKLIQFFREGVNIAWDGGTWEGGNIQDYAVSIGLLVEVTRTERCGETCACAELGYFPAVCYVVCDEIRKAEALEVEGE